MHPLLHFLTQTRLWLIPLAILWLALMALQNEQGYSRFQTVDAMYYRELSFDILQGRPAVIDDLTNGQGNQFSPFPPGYPVMLAFTNLLSGSDTWLNFIFLHGILLILLILVWQNSASLLPLGFVLFSDTALSLASMGISEFAFIISCIFVVFSLSKLEQRGQLVWQISLCISLCFCLWIRYAGLFFLPFLLFHLWFFSDSGRQKFRLVIWPILFFCLFSLFLLGSQWMDSGQLTGGDRYPNSDSGLVLLKDLAIEILNQLCFFQNLSGSSLLSFSAGFLGAMLIIWLIVKMPLKNENALFLGPDELHGPFIRKLALNLFLAGLFYTLIMIAGRWHFYFAETYDTRLLGPGGCLIWLGWAVSAEANLLRQPLSLRLLFLALATLFFLPVESLSQFLFRN